MVIEIDGIESWFELEIERLEMAGLEEREMVLMRLELEIGQGIEVEEP